jgi:hypothetical protein
LRAAFHHHLHVAREPQMGDIRVAGDAGIDQCASQDGPYAVDQGMLHDTIRNVNHAMGAEREQPNLGRAQAPTDGEARSQAKAGGTSRDHGHLRQSVSACQLLERRARRRGNAALAKARATGTGRAVRTGGIELAVVRVHSINVADNSVLGDDAHVPALPQWPFLIAVAGAIMRV